MQSLIVLVFSIFLISCSGMVAPTNSGVSGVADPTSGEAQGVGDGEFQDAKGTDSSGGSTDTTDTDSGGTTDTTGADTTDTTGSDTTDTTGGGEEDDGGAGETIGEITEVETDLDFEPRSAYATVTPEAGMTILIFNSNVSKDSVTRQIVDYGECEEIEEGETGETKFLTITIADAQDYSVFPATEIDIVNDAGFPTLETQKRETPATNAGLAVTYIGGGATLGGGHATADVITFTNLPTAVEEEFEITLDAAFAEFTAADFSAPAGTFKGKIKTIVVPNLDQPEAPDCPDGEYAPANYED